MALHNVIQENSVIAIICAITISSVGLAVAAATLNDGSYTHFLEMDDTIASH